MRRVENYSRNDGTGWGNDIQEVQDNFFWSMVDENVVSVDTFFNLVWSL